MDHSIHEHCYNCYSRACNVTADGFAACKMVECDIRCGSRFHECKRDEHVTVCRDARVPCLNSVYGCPLTMSRSKLGSHLQYCPASVMCCPLEWNRWPLHSQEKNFKMALPIESYPVNCGQLDVALALRDQRMLIDSFKVPSKTRHSLRNIFTKKYPAAPINHRSCSVESDDYASEDTSKGVSDDDDAPWKLGRMPPGLQKSICSQLYKAAKLASNPETLTVTLDLVSDSVSAQKDADERKHVDIHISESESDGSRASSVEPHTLEPAVSKPTDGVNILPGGNVNRKMRNVQLHDVLGVDLIVECISRFKSKPSSMYTFLCAQNFRRDEFPSHSKNVHNDIQSGLNGLMEQRCPLAYLGCTFTCRRLRPKSGNSYVVHSALMESFGLQHKEPKTRDPFVCNHGQNGDIISDHRSQSRSRSRSLSGDAVNDSRQTELKIPTINTGLNWDSSVKVNFNQEVTTAEITDSATMSLLDLPVEIIQHVIQRLDSFSICNLAVTCIQLRDICCTMLEERGIVTQIWERRKKVNEKGEPRSEWHVKYHRWCFSTAFTPVKSWEFMDHPSVSDHLKICPFNKDKTVWSEKFSLFPQEEGLVERKDGVEINHS